MAVPEQPTRACKECGAVFVPKRKDSWFCGKRCRGRHYAKLYKQKHPERARSLRAAIRRRYYEAHRDELNDRRRKPRPDEATLLALQRQRLERARQRAQQWRQENPEKRNKAKRAHYYAHREELAARQRQRNQRRAAEALALSLLVLQSQLKEKLE